MVNSVIGMKTLKIVIVVLVAIAALLATGFFLIGYFKPKDGGIRIGTSPTANVYINGSLMGGTPFRKTFEPGQITIRLEPQATGSGLLLPYETKVNIIPGIETVMRREFGPTEEFSSGDVVSFEKQAEKTAGLIVISSPDNAQVSLDGVPRGFSPYKSSVVSAGSHQITVRSPNYEDRTLSVNTLAGYRLTVFVKLAKKLGEEGGEQSSETPVPELKTYIEILDTPTGYLRVRTSPGASGEEIAEVKPGERYLFLEEDTGTGWYKIQYQEPKAGLPGGITGWVSNQYSKKIEAAGEEIATPSATPT
jgi:hypothetical protein